MGLLLGRELIGSVLCFMSDYLPFGYGILGADKWREETRKCCKEWIHFLYDVVCLSFAMKAVRRVVLKIGFVVISVH